MRTPRIFVSVVSLGIAAVCSAQIPNLTATPSRTPTLTPTITPSATRTPTSPPGQAPTPRPTPWVVGSHHFPVHVATLGEQRSSSATAGADGGFVVAWQESPNYPGVEYDVVARRYDKSGAATSGPFPVNEWLTGQQRNPSIASDSAGNFVVVWNGVQGGPDDEVFARRYDATGTALTSEFQVNTFTTGFQGSADVAMSDNGFVVVWASSAQDGDASGVHARRYDADGNSLGAEFLVNTYTTGEQDNPRVAMAASGSFVVGWRSQDQDGDGSGVFAQRYSADGNPNGLELPVNTYTTGDQEAPDVAASDFDFVATWQGFSDGSGSGIFARTAGPSGFFGPEFQVNTHTTGLQGHPRVARDRPNFLEGGFIVTWDSIGQKVPNSSFPGVFAQRFANAPFSTAAFAVANPPRRGSEYQINTYTIDGQSNPSIAVHRDGRFLIAWDSWGLHGTVSGVFARRFQFPVAGTLKVDQRASGGASNLNGILEAGERVAVDPAWTQFESPGSAPPPLPLAGLWTNMTGPPGATYSLDDAIANYGDIPEGATNDCFTATGNCYEVSVSGPRPSAHWDATFDENLASSMPIEPGLKKTWALHIGGSFPDVPTDAFYPFIENLLHNRVTAGGGCGAGLYCGEEFVLRQQMAVFLLKAAYGPDFKPSPATGNVFDDVPASSPFAPWIEELAREQITGGCTAPPPPALPSYCPTAPVNRQQMAVFLNKAFFGPSIFPPPCAGIFDDVACPSLFADNIEFLFTRGIAAGCQTTPPLFCPTDPTKRKQMAVFLVKTFGLQLYGPD